MIKSKVVHMNSPIAQGEHMHQCTRCLTAWTHDDNNLGDVAEHTCPTCGQEQWAKLRTGDDAAILEFLQSLMISDRELRVLHEVADQYAH